MILGTRSRSIEKKALPSTYMYDIKPSPKNLSPRFLHNTNRAHYNSLGGVTALNLPVVCANWGLQASGGNKSRDIEANAALDRLAEGRGDGKVSGLLEEKLDIVVRVWRGLGWGRRAEVGGRSGGRRLQGENAVGLGAAG